MKIKITFLLIIMSIFCFAQEDYEKQYEEVIPGKEYEAGWLYKIFFGEHWRKLWTTPVKVEVLDLEHFAGGLTPYQKGGGLQTKSLKFKGNDGRIWKFRSINKDPKKILPPEIRESVAADIVQDQISSSNPVAPMIVAPFLDAVGIMQAVPKLVLLPDTEVLGEFRQEYGGLLGMIEIHPDERDDEDIVEKDLSFDEADKIISTYSLLARLEKKRKQKIDDKEFLKARLIDVFLGDWDRHTDQWRWARFEIEDSKIWYPIPRDRDQAFAKYDGMLPTIAEYIVPQLTHFDYTYPQAEDITWNGRFLDRRFLTELDKPIWDSVTNFVVSKLTNDVIEKAVKQLPPEYYNKAGEELVTKLKSRRDLLPEISDEFYELVNEVVDIFGSDEDDFFIVNRLSDDETEVISYRREKKTGKEKGEPLYRKIFDNNLTDEIRINLLDGDDKVLVDGIVNRSPVVRVIGGKGADELEDNSLVKGYFLSITPIPSAENKTIMYDTGKKTKVKYGAGTCYDNSFYPEPKDVVERYEPALRDRGHDWLVYPVINFNSDDGLVLGGGPILYSYNFRANPYEYKMKLIAAYATLPKSYFIEFNGDFYSFSKDVKFNLNIFHSELSFNKYYGYGNETGFDKDLETNNFYRLKQELVTVLPSFSFRLFQNFDIGAGFSYYFSESSLKNDSVLLSNFKYGNYGIGKLNMSSVHSSITYDSRDNQNNAQKGFYINLNASYFPKLFDNKNDFTKGSFDIRSFITSDFITNNTLALRAGGEKLWGTYPFFGAAFLGGENNLRGYRKQRFSGDASLFGQAELRVFLTELKFILKGRFGIHFFGESGRVFTSVEDSDKWHPSYGGGVWMSYLQKILNLNLTVANSIEGFNFYFQTSFLF